MKSSECINELAAALVKAQAEVRNPQFDRVNPAFKSRYASLAAILGSVLPVLSRHGLAVTQTLRSNDAGVECETMLLHTSGQFIADTFALPVAKRDPQGFASASTYARRYALQALVGVTGDEDDDAGAASTPAAPPAAARAKATPDLAERFAQCRGMDDLAKLWKSLSPEQRAAAVDLKEAAKDRFNAMAAA